MPTFSISGVLVARDGTDTNIAANPVTLDVVVPEGQTTFSYSILETFPDDLPEVDISTNDVAVGLSGAGVPAGLDLESDDGATFLGTVTTTVGNFVALVIEVPRPGGGAFDAIFPIGGAVPAIPTNLAEFNALESTVTGFATAAGAFAPGATIDFGTLANTAFDANPNVVQGTDGDDDLVGTAADDFIVTGNSTPFGDFVFASTGNDTIDMSGNDGQNGFIALNYGGLAGPIVATIDGGTNTGSVDKGAAGIDTLLDVQQPLFAGWTNGGLDIRGTDGNDSFDLTPQGQQWVSARGGAGADSYTINGTGLVRMDFRDATQGIEINLGTRQIADDGFGNAETIGGTGSVWEVVGSAADDMFTGSGADESYRYFGGNNTLDGGAGFDRLRYDTGTVASVNIDASTGTVMGALSGGGTFTDTISGFERLRGSDGNDRITGDAEVDNRYEGRGGSDTFVHLGGNDSIDDFEIGTDVLDLRELNVTEAEVAAALAGAEDTPGGARVNFAGGSSVFFNGLSATEVATIQPLVSVPGETLSGGGTSDTLTGGAGDDTIAAGAGNDTIDGGEGDDQINTGIGFDVVEAGGGNDLVQGLNGFDTLNGGAGNDTLQGNFGNDELNGGDGDDELQGGVGFDVLRGDAGNDLLVGRDGFDTLEGGAGSDTLQGNAGNDSLSGGEGDDLLVGGIGSDVMNGDDGADLLQGQGGFDTLDGGAGNDTLQGNNSDDLLNGGEGDDLLEGGFANDILNGDAGADTLEGGNGSDLLNGGDGVDRLEGNAGNDTLDGGAGNDLLRGGLGADTFVFRVGSGNDRIADLGIVDSVELEAALLGGGTPDVEDLRDISALDVNGFLVLDFGNGDTLRFSGITDVATILDDVSFI